MEQKQLVKAESRTELTPAQRDALKVSVPAYLVQMINAGAKVLEVRDAEVANWIVAQWSYYMDRFSDTRNAYILMRRERKA